jgi:hypothetical protein
MTILKHPLSGATYELRKDGNVRVENNGISGIFRFNGQYLSGELRQADPHLLLWMAGPQLPEADSVRKNR